MERWMYLLSGDSQREPRPTAETEHINEEDVESNLSDIEDKLYRRCFDKVDHLCGYDELDVGEEIEQVDPRRDGLISVVKLQKIISRLEHQDNPFYMGPVVRKMDRRKERHLLKQSLHEVDTNHDGFISYEEYKQFVLKMRRGHIFTTQVSRYERIIEYFHTIGHGRHINKWPPPLFIPGVTILQISFFIAYKLHEDVDDSVRDVFNSLEFDPSQRHQVWRYITYSCVHIEWQHLIINMSLQLLVGIILESVHKWWRVAPVYILGVVTASLGYYLVDHLILIGASGGVYSLIAGSFADSIVNWSESRAILYPRCRRDKVAHACDGKLFRLLRLIAVIAFTMFDIGKTVICKEYSRGVSGWAHGFGAGAGGMVGLLWLKDSHEERWERRMKTVAGGMFGVVLLGAVAGNIGGYGNMLLHIGASTV